MQKSTVLVRYGEIGLKGDNRHLFEKKLVDNMEKQIRKSVTDAKITLQRGRIFVEVSERERDVLIELLQNVPGIFSISPSVRIPSELDAMKHAVGEMARKTAAGTFKIEVSRANKQFPMKSPELAAELGGAVLQA
ncbi:MAG: THUMP domain-containing protein, partial [Bacillota bacterium]|nr:THUMP domain-containing protein [Bacillota bacterium]